MERVHDDEQNEYENRGERAHDVPQDGEKPPPPPSKDPEELPGKKQPPAHKDFTTTPGTKIWDEASQRYMEGVDHDRKQATEADYHDNPKPGSGVTRGDTGVD
jgi:hypothetical protein